MTTLFVVQFLALLWNAGLTLAVIGAIGHSRITRQAVTAAFRGTPNDLHLPARPLPATAVPVVSAMTGSSGGDQPAGPPHTAAPGPAPDPGNAVRGPNDVVAPPPRTSRGDTVRDWLVHYAQSQNTSWTDVVTEFYRRAASYPHIAAYFDGVDLDQLARHFTATLVLITNQGLTARAVQRMTVAHAAVRTPDGAPITGEVYDQVVSVLVEVLVDYGVPDHAINELARVIDPLRAAIVVTE